MPLLCLFPGGNRIVIFLSQSRYCYEIIIKTFLIVFRQMYTITYRLFNPLRPGHFFNRNGL